MGRETSIHRRLKRLAIRLLKSRKCTEIKQEYNLLVNSHSFKVDVVGFSKTKRIAIECGETKLSKIERLRKFFDEVITLTVNDLIDFYEQELEKMRYNYSPTGGFSAVKIFYQSKVFQRGKTQIPSEVRKALGVKDGDNLVWLVFTDGSVRVRKMIPDLFRLTDSGRIEELKKKES